MDVAKRVVLWEMYRRRGQTKRNDESANSGSVIVNIRMNVLGAKIINCMVDASMKIYKKYEKKREKNRLVTVLGKLISVD